MNTERPAASTSTRPKIRITSTPTPIILNRRALSQAGEAACIALCAFTCRGSVAAAREARSVSISFQEVGMT